MSPPALPPAPPRWFRDGFLRYNRRLLGRRFAAVRAAGLERLPLHEDGPVVVYLNHPAWWDPLLCAALIGAAGGRRRHVGLIDARNLSGVLARLGFIGIEPGTGAGARRLARLADALAAHPDLALWLTPQGRFADPRERPLGFAGGLALLARRVPDARFVPLAIEYPFLGGRRPEGRMLVGEPLPGAGADTAAFEAALERTLDELAALVVRGDDAAFETLAGAPLRERPEGARVAAEARP